MAGPVWTERASVAGRPGKAELDWSPAPVPPLPAENFAEHERWAWERLAREGVVDLAEFGGGDSVRQTDPRADDWPDHQTLSERFLRAILLHAPWAEARQRPVIRIAHARIVQALDFADHALGCGLHFEHCRFEGALHFAAARIAGSLAFERCLLLYGFSGRALGVEGDLSFASSGSADSITLSDARIGGGLVLRGLRLAAPLLASGLTIGGGADFRALAAEAPADLSDLRCGGRLEMEDSRFEAALDMERIRCAALDLDRAAFRQGMRLVGATIDGNLRMPQATFWGALKANNLVVGGSLLLRNADRLGEINLVGARVAGALDLSGAKLEGPLNLASSNIGGDLSLSAAGLPQVFWGEDSTLNLRNAHVKALHAEVGALLKPAARNLRIDKARRRDFVPTDLAGFEVDRLFGRDAQGGSLADAPANALIRWIEARNDSDLRHDPGPYHRLAAALRAAGQPAKADDLINAAGNHAIRAHNVGWGRKIAGALSWLLIGHGVRIHRALIAFLLLVLAGAMAGWAAEGWAPPYAPPDGWDAWLRASLDNATPIVNFSTEADAFLSQRFKGAPPGWLANLWFAQAIVGFVIASYLAAGLSGFAERRGE